MCTSRPVVGYCTVNITGFILVFYNNNRSLAFKHFRTIKARICKDNTWYIFAPVSWERYQTGWRAEQTKAASSWRMLTRDFSLELSHKLWYIEHKKSTHSKGGCSRHKSQLPLKMRGAHSVCRRGGHYFFRLFLLSRKASNATIKLPKVNNKVKIPRKIEMIS